MDRRDLHPWGEALDDRSLTQAVAMAAALAQAAAVPEHDRRGGLFGFMRALGEETYDEYGEEGDSEDDPARGEDETEWVWHLVASGLRVEPAGLPSLLRTSARSPQELAAMWQAGAPEQVAFVLVGSLTHPQVLAWITALTAIGERHTVHRELPVADPATSWGVPARVAVAVRDETAARWRGVLVELASNRPDLVVDVTDQHGERDLVIFAGPLRSAVAVALTGGRGPRARLVCVLGGADVPAVEAGPMLDVLRNEHGALGVVLTTVESSEARAWLEALLAEETWWVNHVWSHAREHGRPPPFIAAEPVIHEAKSPWRLLHAAAARAELRIEREGPGDSLRCRAFGPPGEVADRE